MTKAEVLRDIMPADKDAFLEMAKSCPADHLMEDTFTRCWFKEHRPADYTECWECWNMQFTMDRIKEE